MTKSASEVREELKKRRKKGGGKHDWFSLKDGDVKYLRVGPPVDKEGEIWKDVYFHGGFKRKVYCAKNDIDPDSGKHRKCLVDKRLKQLGRNEKDSALWKLIKQNTEGLWQVLVAKVKKKDGKIVVRGYEGKKFKLWRLSYKWHNALLDIFADEDLRRKSILGIAHPKYGRLIRVERTGAGRSDTNYTFRPVDHTSPIFEDDHKRHKILKTLVDLDEVVHGSTNDELESFLHHMEKKAKKNLRHEKDESGDESSDSDEDSTSESGDTSSDESSESKSSSDSDESGDLEKQYRKLKKEMKKRKHKKESESEKES